MDDLSRWTYLFRFAKKHGLSREDAEDFAQWCFLRDLQDMRPIGNFFGKALTDYLRSTRGDRRTTLGKIRHEMYKALPLETDIKEEIILEEELHKRRRLASEEKFFALLRKNLTPGRKAIFDLVCRDVKTSEIAKRLNIEGPTVITTMHKVRNIGVKMARRYRFRLVPE